MIRNIAIPTAYDAINPEKLPHSKEGALSPSQLPNQWAATHSCKRDDFLYLIFRVAL